MSNKERLITTYHEMGRAIVGHYLEHSDPVHKISITSRGQALGYTISMPQEDKFLTTKAELTDNLAMTLGGRAAEEIVFGEITTGASNDLAKLLTATAKQMVMRFGISEKLGPRVFGHDHGQPFLGRDFSAEPDYSDEIAREINQGLAASSRPPTSAPRTSSPSTATRSEPSPRSSSNARRSRRRSSRPCSPARPRKRSSAPRLTTPAHPSPASPPPTARASDRAPTTPAWPAAAWRRADSTCQKPELA